MIRSLSKELFSADVTKSTGETVQPAYTQSDATELGVKGRLAPERRDEES
jgi:hypothetical protein